MSGLALVGTVHAQIIPIHFTVTVEDTTTSCTSAPTACYGATAADSTGTYDFYLYALAEIVGTPIDQVRFSVSKPGQWVVLEYELCGGFLLEGDPTVPDEGITIEFADCVENEGWGVLPFLRLRVACTVPGRLQLQPHPVSGQIESRLCPSGEWYHDEYRRYVDVGDFCGRNPLPPECYYCHNYLAGHFVTEPIVATVPYGGAITDTVRVFGSSSCPIVPECGYGPPTGSCLGALTGDDSWIETKLIGVQGIYYTYEVVLNADGLAAGEYAARLVVNSGGCGDCISNCQEVRFRVEELVAAGEADATRGPTTLRIAGANPTSGTVDVRLAVTGTSPISIIAFDASGRQVARIVEATFTTGVHVLSWDPRSAPGGPLAPGVYFVRLDADGSSAVAKVVLAGADLKRR